MAWGTCYWKTVSMGKKWDSEFTEAEARLQKAFPSGFTVLIMGKQKKNPDVSNVLVFETIPKVHMLFTNKEQIMI